MPRALKYVTFLDLLFILFISAAGFIGGAVGDVVYYLAFVVPVFIAFALKKANGVEFSPPRLKISAEGAVFTLPIIAPVLAAVFLISWLTSLLLGALGAENTVDMSGNVFVLILTHALLTSILEEALFRYVPIAFIAPHSKKHAIIISALFFAFAHCNLFQIPYAFFAGLVFAAVDIATDSILPSLLVHFLNNLISIFWIRGSGDTTFVLVYVFILVSLALLSLIPILIMRKRYAKRLSDIFSARGDVRLSYEPMLFLATTLFVALISL